MIFLRNVVKSPGLGKQGRSVALTIDGPLFFLFFLLHALTSFVSIRPSTTSRPKPSRSPSRQDWMELDGREGETSQERATRRTSQVGGSSPLFLPLSSPWVDSYCMRLFCTRNIVNVKCETGEEVAKRP
ncbi:hypothetical protein IE53DRAFT_158574 [Violaceomyces palustris]|uniref:Uncharacterized protein n=1 Tax=Violaceomyces palustris TaxID=1673888 RepID=A0ACD0P643_9BASI|nr:hypothetical protein IE53DRAFT_158574 [Violaceomyces palustris]